MRLESIAQTCGKNLSRHTLNPRRRGIIFPGDSLQRGVHHGMTACTLPRSELKTLFYLKRKPMWPDPPMVASKWHKACSIFSGKKKNRINKPSRSVANILMATIDDRLESPTQLSDHQQIQDQGGSRSGRDRRQSSQPFDGSERRSDRDRRRGFDRRGGIERRRSSERRNGRYFRDGELVERRDVFRRRTNEQ
jgi:hypothetical protein